MNCLLDLDGVLVDFNSKVFELLDRPNDVFIKNPEFRGQYWVDDILGLTGQEFWNVVNSQGSFNFWRNLPKTEEFDQIVNAVIDVFGIENICILTKPCLDSDSHKGKYEWICEHLPMFKDQYLMGRPKKFCAHSNAILVDDMDYNVDEFIENGGYGVIVPRYWNRRHELYHVIKKEENWAYDLLLKELTIIKNMRELNEAEIWTRK